MKRILLSLLMLVALTSLQAQRKKTLPKPVLPDMTVEEALAKYDFPSAELLINNEIATLKKAKQPTFEQEAKLQWLRKAQIKLNAVERVSFIDSLIVPRNEVLKSIHLSPECGTLHNYSDFFHKTDTMDCTVFKSQLGDQIFFSQADEQSNISLYNCDIYGDNSISTPTILDGISDNEGSQNYPFVMTDGTTIYFAAQGTESLGGYDIFMSRYDPDEHRFLSPENIGMPFNSPANDYLYVIDEFNNLGWFVTDRNTSGDSVCIYIFIPNEIRQVYVPEELGADTLRSFARINRISDTWQDELAVRAAQFRLRALKASTEEKENAEFDFIVTDNQIYHKTTDFRNESARNQVGIWLQTRKQLKEIQQQLALKRKEYPNTLPSQRENIKEEILSLETNEERLFNQVKRLEKEIRKAELGL